MWKNVSPLRSIFNPMLIDAMYGYIDSIELVFRVYEGYPCICQPAIAKRCNASLADA